MATPADLLRDKLENASEAAPSSASKPKPSKIDMMSLEAFPSLKSSSTSVFKPAAAKPARTSYVTETFQFVVSPQLSSRAARADAFARAKSHSGVLSIDSSTSKSSITTFIVKGTPDAIAIARRELVKGLTEKISDSFSIPSSVRAFVIGSGGKTLKQIEQTTSTRIKVDKGDDIEATVTVDGDIDGVAQAKSAILAIVDERTKTLSTRVQFDAEIAPFVKIDGIDGVALKLTPTAVEISGDRDAVNAAKTALTQSLETLKLSIASTTATIPKAQQSYISVYDETGCIVKTDDTDVVTFTGPRQQLQSAVQLAIQQASSVTLDSIDISKAHNRNVSHAADVVRYFDFTKLLQSIEKELKVNITHSGTVFNIAGVSSAGVKAARKRVVDLVNSIPPSRVAHVPCPLKLARVSSHAEHVHDQFSVTSVVGDEDILLVYDKEDDEFGPDPAELSASLDSAKNYYTQLIQVQQSYVQKVVPVQVKFQTLVQNELKSEFLSFDGAKAVLFGPPDQVESLAARISTLVEEAIANEILNSYTDSFEYPEKYSSQLIGRNGSQIQKYRTEFNVSINFTDGVVTIKGQKEKVNAAKARILELATKLAHEVTVTVAIPNKFHASLIGQKGKFVNRLQERYAVRILFPRADSADSDEITIRGTAKNVEKAKEELIELYKYDQEHAHSEKLDVPKSALARIIGKNGEFINQLMQETGAKIDISKDEQAVIVITGTEKSVGIAKRRIQEIVDELNSITTKTIDVPKKYHSFVIGKSGTRIRQIVEKCGGIADQAHRIIRIPPASSPATAITITGNSNLVDSIYAEIARLVAEYAERVTAKIEIPVEKHGYIIGPAGDVKRAIEKEFGVAVTVPRDGSNIVVIEGAPVGVDGAKAKIAEVTTRPERARRSDRKKPEKSAEKAAVADAVES